MRFVCGVCVVIAIGLIAFIMLEGFETLVLPRRIERRLRLTRLFYQYLWRVWTSFSPLLPADSRDNFHAVFGPLSLLLLFSFWANGLIFSFALLQWGLGTPLHAPETAHTFQTYLYLSATTFITLGFGDVAPVLPLGRALTNLEAGLGFGFLAIVIGYLPVLYNAFSRREVDIALLDARASSPPSAGELLKRTGVRPDNTDLLEMLRGYERWSAELLESHLSYPVLMYYRSQHDRQSWLSALTTILDTCAFIIATLPEGKLLWQARMTFAMSRHAAVDLALIFDTPPRPPDADRLDDVRYADLRRLLTDAGMRLVDTTPDTPLNPDGSHKSSRDRLGELRRLYEPYCYSLSRILRLNLPSWLPNPNLPDNWQTSHWDRNDHFFQSPEA